MKTHLHKSLSPLHRVAQLLLLTAILMFTFGSLHAQTYPTGFSQVLVANGISNPTVMAFAPDGRIFVAQQNGQLRVVKNGTLLATPFVSLSVSSSGERGLLGIAFDPNFAVNQFVYLHYTVLGGTHNRISRFTANGDLAVAGSESVLLNLDPLSSATNHNGGNMQFGPDGKLYVAIGENANGQQAQNLDLYHGKILRINTDGSVPAGNPFTTGSAQRQRVWSYGLRNPYTIAFQPGTGKLFVNDVGQGTWEEINDATVGGLNFGWPTAEGNSTNPAFTNPVYQYANNAATCAITGGTFFNPATTNYPSTYIGKYFYIDFCGNWINALNPNATPATSTGFATGIAGSPVSIMTGPDGNLYFLSRSNGAVYKVTYSGGAAPVITTQPQSQTVSQNNAVSFSVTATGASLTYQWRKNGVNISGATNATYTIASAQPSHAGTYSVMVSNAGGSVISNNATLTVNAPNQGPVATINTPTNNTFYNAGSTINYTGSATDPEQGTLPASAFQWYVMFHHDTHTHPGPTAQSGVTSGSFAIPNSGETATDVFYRLYLVVTDAQGAKDTAFVNLLPNVVTLTVATNPSGLQITVDGQPFTSPYSTTSVVGMLRSIGTASPQTINGALTYNFTSWNNGGTQTKTITTPSVSTTYTATFAAALRTAENPANTVNGLNYSYYQGSWNVLPDFSTLSPVASGAVLNFDISPRTVNDDFGFRFVGYVNVPTDGVYTFYTSSDDGSKLYIGNTLVVNNDGLHAPQETSGQIGLKAGKHAVRVDFFEHLGGEVLSVSYAGPGIAKQAIPNAALYRVTTTQTFNLTPVADSYVRSGGSFANTNFGTANIVATKKANNNTQETYLRFDISTFGNAVSSAKLRMYGSINNTGVASIPVEVHQVTNNTWGETTINYTNRPAAQATVLATTTVTGTTDATYEWDLTSFIASAKASGATTVSLLLRNTNTTSNSRVTFNSKEATSNKPQLVVVSSPAGQREGEVLFGNDLTSSTTVYPNPATTNFTLQVPEELNSAWVTVYDLNGRVVQTLQLNETTTLVETQDFANGTYLVTVQNENAVARKKIIVSK